MSAQVKQARDVLAAIDSVQRTPSRARALDAARRFVATTIKSLEDAETQRADLTARLTRLEALTADTRRAAIVAREEVDRLLVGENTTVDELARAFERADVGEKLYEARAGMCGALSTSLGHLGRGASMGLQTILANAQRHTNAILQYCTGLSVQPRGETSDLVEAGIALSLEADALERAASLEQEQKLGPSVHRADIETMTCLFDSRLAFAISSAIAREQKAAAIAAQEAATRLVADDRRALSAD